MTDSSVHVSPGSDLIADVLDEGLRQGDVQGVFGGHGGPYQIPCMGVTLPRVRLRSMGR